MWCPRPALSIVLTLCFAVSLSAQTDCSHRTIPVSVFDRKTGQILEPSIASFKGTYRGKPIRVTSVTPNELPPRVIVLLDVSGSMALDPYPSPPNMVMGLTIARDLFSRLQPPAEIGFAIFADKMERVVSLTNNRPELVAAANSVERSITDVRARLGGSTALWNSVAETATMFGNVRVGDTIFAITDGEDNFSRGGSSPENVIANLASAGIRLFRVERRRGVPQTNTSSGMTDLLLVRSLQVMIQDTGGQTTALSVPLATADLPRVRETFDLQYRIIRNFSRVSVELPEAVRQSADWRLELANVPGNDLEVVYPRKLPACR